MASTSSEYLRSSGPSAIDAELRVVGSGIAGDKGEESAAENAIGFDRVLSTPPQSKEKGKKRGNDDLTEKKGLSEQPAKKRKCRPKVADDKFSLKKKKAKVKISKLVKAKRVSSKKDAPNKRNSVRKKKDQPNEAVAIYPPFADEGKLNDTEGRDAVVSGESLLDSAKGEESKGTCRRVLEFNDENSMFVSTILNPDNEMGLGVSSLFLGETKVQATFSGQIVNVALEPPSAEEGKFSNIETNKAVEPPSFEEEKFNNSEAGEVSVSGDRLLKLDEDKDFRRSCGKTLDFLELNAISTVAMSKLDTEMELHASQPLWLQSDGSKKHTSAPIVYVRKKKMQAAVNIQLNVVFHEPTSAKEVKANSNESGGGAITGGTLLTSVREEDIEGSSRHALDIQVENTTPSVAISQTNQKMTRAVSSSNSKNKDCLETLYNPLVANGWMMRACQCIQLMRKCKRNVLKIRKKPRMLRKRRVDMSGILSSSQTLKQVGSKEPILQCQELSIPTRKQRSKTVTRRRDFSSLLTVPWFIKSEASALEQQCRTEIPKTDIWPTHGNLVTRSKGTSLSQEEKICVISQEVDHNEEQHSRGFDTLFTINEHLFSSNTRDDSGYALPSYVSNQMDSAFGTGVDYSSMNIASHHHVSNNLHTMVPWTNDQVPVHTNVYTLGSCYPSQNSLPLQADFSVRIGDDFHTTYQPPLWDTAYTNIQLPNPLRFSVSNEQESVPDTRGVFCRINDPNHQNAHYNQSLVPHLAHRSTEAGNYSVNSHLWVPYCEPSTLTHGQELVSRIDTSLDIVSAIGNRALVTSTKRKKVIPHVNFDSKTLPMWRVLMGIGDSTDHQCNEDEESTKWWREERCLFEEKVQAFISCMHKIQGNRRFSQWKGSVLDSVMGVFLTQNVSDHLSSSAYMSLAAKYPVELTHTQKIAQEENECVVGTSQESCGSSETVVVASTNELSDQEVLNERLLDDEQATQLQNPVRTDSRNDFDVKSCTEDVLAIPTVGLKGFEEWLSLQGQMTQPQDSSHPQSETEECLSQREQEQTTQSQNPSCPKSETDELLSPQQEQTTQPLDFSHPKSEAEELISHQQEQATQPQNSSHPKSETETTIPGPRLQKNETPKIDWLKIKRKYCNDKRERHKGHTDSVDWEAVRRAPVEEVADTIKKRGQHNILAVSMQKALNRIFAELGSLDLEWLRDTPPEITKDFLLSINGLGLKSVECIRLLALEQVAFPVDTNVGRIAVRMGWVDLKDVPEGLQFHLLEQYPMMDAIQKYLWPRLCELDQLTLYELHYQMITFGKVFCKKRSPYCNACPLRARCKYFASAFVSARLPITDGADSGLSQSLPLIGDNVTGSQTTNHEPTVEMLSSSEPYIEMPTSTQPYIEMPTSPEPYIEMPTSPEPYIEMPTSPEPYIEMPTSPEHLSTPEEHLLEIREFPEPVGKVAESVNLTVEMHNSPESEHGGTVGDIEDLYNDVPEIPTIVLNDKEFIENLSKYIEEKQFQMGGEISNALVVSAQAARIPARKLKNIKDLRTEHLMYEIPDSHPLLRLYGLSERDPDDTCFYLLSMWSPDESAILFAKTMKSNSNGGDDKEKCSSSQQPDAENVLGTFMIPCRTAMRGRFPLNGTYFQVNEVFADNESSHRPVKIPRSFLWNLNKCIVYCGSSTSSITAGLTTKEIQVCFWRDYVCVRGFDRRTQEPKELVDRLHKLKTATQTKRVSVSKEGRSKKNKI